MTCDNCSKPKPSVHEVLKNAHLGMQAKLNKSWFYWILVIVTALGSNMRDTTWDDKGNSAFTYVKRYLESTSFVRMLFLNFIDKDLQKDFKTAINIMAQYFDFKKNLKDQDVSVFQYPIDILDEENNRVLMKQMTDKDFMIYQRLHLTPQALNKLVELKTQHANLYDWTLD